MELPGGRKLDYVPPQKTIVTGVRGFLLFLCISFVFISPSVTAYALVNDILKTHGLEMNLFTVLWFGQNIFLSLWFMAAGILLWARKRAGLVLVKILLFFKLGLSFFYLVLEILLASVKQLPSEQTVLSNASQFFISMAVPVVYLWYLFKSQRVKNTYAKPLSESETESGETTTG